MFISRISRHPFGAYAALLLLQILSTHHRCSARKSSNHCAPFSCGNFLNISSPFRLNTDRGSCGDRFIELGCEDNVRLTLHLNMVKYYVEAINYSDSTIRLVDAAVQKDDCFSIPHHSLTEEVLSSLNFYYNNYHYDFDYKYHYIESSMLTFICCENEILNPPDYIMDTSSCTNGSSTAQNSCPSCVNMEGHSYVMVDGLMKDVPDLCRVNLMHPIPKNVTNMSYADILADGFKHFNDNYEYYYFNDHKYHYMDSSVLTFICCENEMLNPLPDYIMDTSSCKNGSGTAHNSSPSCVNMEGHSYVMVDGLMKDVPKLNDVPDLCRVNLMYTVPKNVTNMSYTDVHDILADGFELQWYIYSYTEPYPGDLFNLFHEGEEEYYASYCGGYYRYTTPPLLLSFLMLFLPAILAFIVIYHVLLFPCGLPCLLTLLIYKWRRRHLSMYDNIEKFLQSHDNDLVPIRYTYSEIKKITNGFKNKLGEGGFGSVYKGKLRSGRFAAVKLLGNSKANGQDFINEVATIGRIHHVKCRVASSVSVEGRKQCYFIYEFSPNGSLEK
uniref:Protein kinase domain-containing protein n=1 Tax=Salix viminalis TaxID=40686 RepID=A0A6N2KHB5_SALVM